MFEAIAEAGSLAGGGLERKAGFDLGQAGKDPVEWS
jgi:hypothetical protein